jgi:hypothetical protein
MLERLDDVVASLEADDRARARLHLWNLVVELASIPDAQGHTDPRALLNDLLAGLVGHGRWLAIDSLQGPDAWPSRRSARAAGPWRRVAPKQRQRGRAC